MAALSLLRSFIDAKKVVELVKLTNEPELAKEIQLILIALGYLDDKADGIIGPKTLAAFTEFKQDNNQGHYNLLGAGSARLLLEAYANNKVKPKNDYDLAKEFYYTTDLDWDKPTVRIGKYFVVRDVTKGDKRRIPRSQAVKDNIIRLVKELDRIREEWGGPIGVVSWYRPEPINRMVSKTKNSQHINGSAADVYPIGGDVYKFQAWLDKRWNKALGYGAKLGFVHIDLRPSRIRWNY